MPAGHCCFGQLDDPVVTAGRSVHHPHAALVALDDPASCAPLEYDDNRWLQPAGGDGAVELPAQVRRGFGAVPPPAVGTGTHDIRCVHHEHPFMMSPATQKPGREARVSMSETGVSVFGLTVLAAVCHCGDVQRLVVVIPERVT
jgi:hypothetical protein